ncbi:hypothetical protein HUO13_05750 [Saccharopolyspora erythraea]|uniref:hypothetical protein n=1 Tax=Saccharopolyspora erythraea TaxID=1836 RepID=UPI001BA50396|nr:hypothetical protein [Saccharopolyspora erythraea]QUH00386.1 hypothetical protein HUO13_05750 [Saccharopolyspora erythraea]
MHPAAVEALAPAPGVALAPSDVAFVPTDVVSVASASGRLVLASHPIITAVPFFVPTFVVAAVIGIVIWRDRRRGRDEDEGADGTPGAGADPEATDDHPAGP